MFMMIDLQGLTWI